MNVGFKSNQNSAVVRLEFCDKALAMSLYLEDFLDELIEQLPGELRDRFTDMREMDFQVENGLNKNEAVVREFFQRARDLTPEERKRLYERIKEDYSKSVEDAAEKVSMANNLHTYVERYLQTLDAELGKLKIELESDNPNITKSLEKKVLRTERRGYAKQEKRRRLQQQQTVVDMVCASVMQEFGPAVPVPLHISASAIGLPTLTAPGSSDVSSRTASSATSSSVVLPNPLSRLQAAVVLPTRPSASHAGQAASLQVIPEADPAPPQKSLKAPVAVTVTSKPPAASAPVNKLQPTAVAGRKAESSSSDDSSDDEATAKPTTQKPVTVQVKKPVGSVLTTKVTTSAPVVATKKNATRGGSSSDSDDSSEDEGNAAKPTNAGKSAKPAATAVKGSAAAASKPTLAAGSKKAETSSSDSDSSDSGKKGGKTPTSVLAVNGPAAKTANTLAKAAATSKKPAPKKASSSDDSSSSDDEQQTVAVKQVNSAAGISQAAKPSTKPVSASSTMPSHSKQQPAREDSSSDSSSEDEKKTTKSASSVKTAPSVKPAINKATPKVPLKSAAKESSSSYSSDSDTLQSKKHPAAMPQAHANNSLSHTPANQNAPTRRRGNDEYESGELSDSSSADENPTKSGTSAARLDASTSATASHSRRKRGHKSAASKKLRQKRWRANHPPPAGNASASQAGPSAFAPQPQIPGLILMRGLPTNASFLDIAACLSGFQISPGCIQFQRTPYGRLTGDVVITLASPSEAERAVREKQGNVVDGCLVWIFPCGL